ncbi:hypothetical protein [Comamonas sp. JC664]|uniref:hypothetical protein n=1 Tax=Comamonas sp. JC664 TaxID=2801917 RepID=UPI003614410E
MLPLLFARAMSSPVPLPYLQSYPASLQQQAASLVQSASWASGCCSAIRSRTRCARTRPCMPM